MLLKTQQSQQQNLPPTLSEGATVQAKAAQETPSRAQENGLHISGYKTNNTSSLQKTLAHARTNFKIKKFKVQKQQMQPAVVQSKAEQLHQHKNMQKTQAQATLKNNPILKNTYMLKTKNRPCKKSRGKIATNTAIKYKLTNKPSVFPKTHPIKEDIGKYGLMWPRGAIANSHPAATMLQEFSEVGCPVDTGTNWTKKEIETAIRRGPHVSAKDPHALKCLHDEVAEKLKGGYIQKTTWGQIKIHFHHISKSLL